MFLFESNSLKKNHLLSLQSNDLFILGSPFVEPQVQLLPRKYGFGGRLLGEQGQNKLFAASQEVWVSRPPIGKQNNCRFRDSGK